MRIEDIKPIPTDVKKEIKRIDAMVLMTIQRNRTRYYAYYSVLKNGELAKYTIAAKTHPRKGNLMMKIVAVRDSVTCFARDMTYTNIGGYQVNWDNELHGNTTLTTKYSFWDQSYNYQMWNPWAHQICTERLQNTSVKYSGYECCDEQGIDILKYITVWKNHPMVEYLMKSNVGYLAMKKSIVLNCEKDKQFVQFIRKNLPALQQKKVACATIYKAYALDIPVSGMEMFTDESQLSYVNDIKTIIRGSEEVRRLVNYLETNHIDASFYGDYVHACIALKVDMADTKNKYPKDFYYWHTMRIDQYVSQRHPEGSIASMLDVYCKYKKLQKMDQYCVLLARTKSDLVFEGSSLHHCVGRMNYDQRMIREESLIFFVRTPQAPGIPFVTLEYSLKDKKIKQLYGEHDSRPPQEVIEWINTRWLPYAKRAQQY